MLTAVRGAVGFCTRIPVGADERAWTAFRATPATFPLAGYLVGALAAAAPVGGIALGLPAPTVALAAPLALVAVTGIAHLDGLADLGDAAVVHGGPDRRLAVVRDTTVGVGAAFAVVVDVAGLALAWFALAGLAPASALGIAVAAEVAAKLGMAAVGCLGTATHDGLGAQLTARQGPAALVPPALLALPAAALTWPHPAAPATLVGGLAATGVVLWWARRNLGGVGGDVFGAANECARLGGLHAGVIAWTVL